MIAIPYLTRLGGVVGFKFRQPHECTDSCGHQKYLTPYPTRLYNTTAFDRADRLGLVAITEGEFDAEILDHYCDIPAVAVPGVETWKKHPEWKELFRGYERVLVFPDGDEQGRGLASSILRDIDTAHIVSLPAGKDVSEAYKTMSADEIRRAANV